MSKSIKLLILFFGLVFLCVNSYSQNKVIDSLQNELSKTQNKIKIIDLNLSIAKEYIEINVDSAKKYTSLAKELIENEDYKFGNGILFLYLGKIETIKGNYSVAFDFLLKALKIFEEENNDYYKTTCLIYLGENSRASLTYPNAIKYLTEAEKSASKINNKQLLNKIYNRLAATYFETSSSENSNAKTSKSYCYKTIDLSNELNDSIMLSNSYNILGMIYNMEVNTKEAVRYLRKAIAISEKLNLSDLPNYLINLATIQYYSFNYEESLGLALRAYELSVESDIKVYILRSSLMLSKIYEAIGDKSNELYYYKIFSVTNDSLYSSRTIAKIEELTYNYNLEKKEKELSTAKLYIYLTISLAIVVMIIASSLFIILKKSKKHNKELKELNAILNEQNEKIRLYAEQLASANADKDKFYSIIAHDLRTPFNPILGFSEILYKDYMKYTEAERSEMAGMIFSSSRNLMNLLDNLLQWSRVKLKKIKVIKKDISLGELVKENLDLLGHNIAQKELQIINSVKENCVASGDREMVSFIIRNFLSNAIKFSDRKGVIKIYTEEKNNFIKFSIEDSGVGISEENIKSIFSINNFNTTSGTEGEKGTGLGLAISLEFISFNGGELFVESVEKKGCIFSFTLPVVSQT